MERSLIFDSRHFGGRELFPPCPWDNHIIIAMVITTRMIAAYWMLTICWVQRAALSSFYLYSCLHHWLPYHTERKDLEHFFMPALISSLKRNSSGENSQTKLDALCLSGFSANLHYMLQNLDYDMSRLPRRVGARPCGARPWAVRLSGPWQGSTATSCRCGAAVWLLFSLRQACGEEVIWVMYLA